MISAESLFLSDAGAPEDRGELRYRLAIRAAFFIESPLHSKREIYRHMKRAYDARSAIIHGASKPESRLLKSLKEEPISLEEFTKLTEGLLRTALQKAIGLAGAGSGFQVDWDTLIIPEQPWSVSSGAEGS